LIPWRAFDFRTFFFETAGVGKNQAAVLNSCGGFAAAFGAAFGGWVGDKLNGCWPLHGRVLAAEISVYGGIPFAFFTFFVDLPAPPGEGDNAWLSWLFIYAAMLTLGLGFVASWCAGACNNPILSALASESDRALILSWQASLEGAIGALGPIIFTYLMDVLNYNADCNDPCAVQNGIIECEGVTLDDNKRAAGLALTLTSVVPWSICGLLYSCLHCTYPGDLAKLDAQRAALAEGLDTELATAIAQPVTELATAS